jgi:hypothetical protein
MGHLYPGIFAHPRVIVGVHVREHDSRFDWAVVPPSPGAGGGEGDGSAEEFGEGKHPCV